MAKGKKGKKKKSTTHPKVIAALTASIEDPSKLGDHADLLGDFGLSIETLREPVAAANGISDDPDAADSTSKFEALPFPVKVALLDVLAEEGAIGFIARLKRDTQDKGLSKAIGAAIQKLRSQGLDVPDLAERAGVSFQAVAEPAPQCHVTPVDGEGNRVVVLTRTGPEGLMVYYALCGDTEGIGHLEGVAMPRGAFRRFVKMVSTQVNAPMVPVDEIYATWLIEGAVAAGREAGTPIPPAFDSMKNLLPDVPGTFATPIWNRIPRSEVEGQADLVADSKALHDQPEFASWIPDEKGLTALRDKLEEAADSKIELTDAQKSDRRRQIIEQCAMEWLTPEIRQALARRLAENAFILAETNREQDARVALAVGCALEDTKTKATDIPFALQMYEKLPVDINIEELRPPVPEPTESAG